MASPVGDSGLWRVGIHERKGFYETQDREGLCVSICTAVGSPISTVYSR